MHQSTISSQNTIIHRLPRAEWKRRQTVHQEIICEIVDPYLIQKKHQHKDPVLDFLFDYYAFRPSHLKRWSPGVGVMLEQADRRCSPEISELTITPEGAVLDPAHFPDNRRDAARWMLQVLKKSREKSPSFACSGMHEWAMVYRADTVRHQQFPLRLTADELAEFVESRPLVCTHFDAFRFFSKPARPMNKFTLSRAEVVDNEQPGCLHTNMDLYKWAFKLFPWISSRIIREAFLLAVDTRVMDMKASPYDLSERGLEPIKIETPRGRKEYAKQQQKIYERSRPVRASLINAYQQLIAHF